ncbi:MAG: P-loop NTPase, partial [Mycoplasmataceae bacterium]|nr:P-loop NTPase [Mycoplasmataceae bacterium]
MKIAIASGKGGTGKTTLSSNLAKYLSINKKVVLSDLDVEEPNSGLFLHGNEVNSEKKYKMIPQYKGDGCLLCGKCQKVCNFNAVMKMGKTIMVFPELCHGCYACSELCPANCLPMEKKQMGELKEFKVDNLNFVE